MSDLRLDPATGDLQLTGGSITLVTGADAIAQQIRIRVKFFLGEWFLDTRIGVPYFQKILGKKPRRALLDFIFRKLLLTTPGVASIDSFSQTFDGPTRTLLLSFVVTTVADGLITFNKEPFII